MYPMVSNSPRQVNARPKDRLRVTITRISGKDEIRQHLADLGFIVEAKVLIISQMGGNLIVQVKGSRVALDRSMAERIFF